MHYEQFFSLFVKVKVAPPSQIKQSSNSGGDGGDKREMHLACNKICCDSDICDIRSVREQSGRTTGRLGSTGLRAMPSEGRHSRHSGASTADNAPVLGTTSDDYRPAATCRSMDLAAAAGARANRMSRLWAGEAASG
jgi:hypothetical protein